MIYFYFSISIWRRLCSGGHRQTQTTSSLFFLMPRYQTDVFTCWETHYYLCLWGRWIPASVHYFRVSQWAQRPASSFTSERRRSIAAALTEKGSINTGENVVLLYPPGGFCLLLPVCVDLLILYRFNYRQFSTPLYLSLRNWFDSRLLRLPLRWMCSCKCQTTAPSEPGSHATDCPHDYWCEWVLFYACMCLIACSWVCVYLHVCAIT